MKTGTTMLVALYVPAAEANCLTSRFTPLVDSPTARIAQREQLANKLEQHVALNLLQM